MTRDISVLDDARHLSWMWGDSTLPPPLRRPWSATMAGQGFVVTGSTSDGTSNGLLCCPGS